MRFVHRPVEEAVEAVTAALSSALARGEKVLWLVSGGSNIKPEVAIMEQLRLTVADVLPNLTILPIDERFGPKGHENSNAAALRTAGFNPGAATWYDILDDADNLAATTDAYNQLAARLLDQADTVVAVCGLGADGHTAGILPHSPALTGASFTAFSYEWSDFTRLTLTPAALKRCNTVFVLAYGVTKQTALETLASRTSDTATTPALLLWDISDTTVYNDSIETEGV